MILIRGRAGSEVPDTSSATKGTFKAEGSLGPTTYSSHVRPNGFHLDASPQGLRQVRSGILGLASKASGEFGARYEIRPPIFYQSHVTEVRLEEVTNSRSQMSGD